MRAQRPQQMRSLRSAVKLWCTELPAGVQPLLLRKNTTLLLHQLRALTKLVNHGSPDLNSDPDWLHSHQNLYSARRAQRMCYYACIVQCCLP